VRFTDCDVDMWFGGEKYDSIDFTYGKIETSATMGVDSINMVYNNADLVMSGIILSEDIIGRPFSLGFICVVPGVGGDKVITEDQVDILLEGGLVGGEDMILEAGEMVGPFTIIGGHSLFYGLIADWDLDEEEAKIEVQNELVFWSKRTLRKCSSSCPWEFKGTECGYSGGQTWCNQSYERCDELSNTDNFGGFRFLPTIAEKDIWWGRSKG